MGFSKCYTRRRPMTSATGPQTQAPLPQSKQGLQWGWAVIAFVVFALFSAGSTNSTKSEQPSAKLGTFQGVKTQPLSTKTSPTYSAPTITPTYSTTPTFATPT